MTAAPDPTRPTPARMGRGWRDRAWSRRAEGPFDVLVVGGGITGAGIARRAAQAGLRTALVEKGDLAAGTSAWSSKLVHGGLRYLAHLQVGVVRQSVHGREALQKVKPEAQPGMSLRLVRVGLAATVKWCGMKRPMFTLVPPATLVPK